MHAVVLNKRGYMCSIVSPKSLDLDEVRLATEEEISRSYKPYHLKMVNDKTGRVEDTYLGPEELVYYTHKD